MKVTLIFFFNEVRKKFNYTKLNPPLHFNYCTSEPGPSTDHTNQVRCTCPSAHKVGRSFCKLGRPSIKVGGQSIKLVSPPVKLAGPTALYRKFLPSSLTITIFKMFFTFYTNLTKIFIKLSAHFARHCISPHLAPLRTNQN